MNGKKPEGLAKFWDTVYQKPEKELSWYEPVPMTSLSLIDTASLSKKDPIIDIGGGEGTLARHLLVLGYENITVLDISARALEIGQKRLGDMASGITWIHANILHFEPPQSYVLWHDRATFHFMTHKEEQQAYLQKAHESIQPNGHFILGTFSEKGPARCSGLPVQRYSEKTMNDLLKDHFTPVKNLIRQHITPLHKLQEFLYGKYIRY